MNRIPSLTIVVPCFNEEAVLAETASRMLKKLDQLHDVGLIGEKSCVLFVDDGSSDSTWDIIERLASKGNQVRGVKLSRNRGHQNALLAGLMASEGDVVISIDADLQDDVDAMDQMIEKYLNGYDVVYGVRSKREKDTFFKRNTAQAYYGLLKALGVDLVYNHADYRLLSRPAIDALKQFSEVNLFLRGIVPLLGFKSDSVYYERSERFAGESKYPLRRMLAFAVEGITAFSNVPLRLITGIGICISLVAFLMIFWVVWVRFTDPGAVPGWASTIVPMLFLGGIQLLSLGVVGEYVSKIYLETKRRPKYVIEKVVGSCALNDINNREA